MTFSINEVLVLPEYCPRGQESSLIYNSWGKSTKPSHEPMTDHKDITGHTEYVCNSVRTHIHAHTNNHMHSLTHMLGASGTAGPLPG